MLQIIAVFLYCVTFSLETVFCFIAYFIAEGTERPVWSGAELLISPGVWLQSDKLGYELPSLFSVLPSGLEEFAGVHNRSILGSIEYAYENMLLLGRH